MFGNGTWTRGRAFGALARPTARVWMVLVSACSSSNDERPLDQSHPGDEPPLIELLLRANEVHVAGLEIRCELCGCGGIVGGEPETRYCIEDVVLDHPDIVADVRRLTACAIRVDEQRLPCLEAAADCAAAEACGAAGAEECTPDASLDEAYAMLARELELRCGDD